MKLACLLDHCLVNFSDVTLELWDAAFCLLGFFA